MTCCGPSQLCAGWGSGQPLHHEKKGCPARTRTPQTAFLSSFESLSGYADSVPPCSFVAGLFVYAHSYPVGGHVQAFPSVWYRAPEAEEAVHAARSPSSSQPLVVVEETLTTSSACNAVASSSCHGICYFLYFPL